MSDPMKNCERQGGEKGSAALNKKSDRNTGVVFVSGEFLFKEDGPQSCGSPCDVVANRKG